ncbi:family 50 glycosyltransferase [Cryphonectria parasitica EP155]|uniref:GPI mannosyltransferase 1 n=1 Tax=Cryphonectria parasitica (strain ATCC 38755 / EP155) TaxID=660469 RepID=A0A9P5CKJ5_CRYP1|nr:family 50 glycosyltransferase [Cryphonectria parasitica EP155]KAF3762138.1 family 50 glycosyltransferase [Cryphonectria parasitica EP155]
MGALSSLLASSIPLFTLAAGLRILMLLCGLWQDANSPVKYTDIDYLVFTDAARFVAQEHPQGPYARETYRYTPLLSWMLLPTTWPAASRSQAVAFFSSGKVLFAVADLVAGWLIVEVLTMQGPRRLDAARARKYAAIWLLNPMVATISTRGSSEGLLAVMVMALLWAVLSRRVSLAAMLLGFGVHLKIYPFIYAPAIIWWMDDERMRAGKPSSSSPSSSSSSSPLDAAVAFLTASRLKLAVLSLATFFGLNLAMYAIYGHPFLLHTFLHHVTRIDHRHNFSPYNILLYLTSADPGASGFGIESVAFLPQLLLSCVLIPLAMAKKDLSSTMLAQTWIFVTFNKVCTSQYFLWYLILLPLYLPRSSFLERPGLGLTALALWVLTQAAWLQQGYQLEFLGQSTFVPGLWVSALGFFLANCWILGVIVGDVA